MKKSRFTEEQIAFALKEAEQETSVPDVCRKLGISDATFSPRALNTPVFALLSSNTCANWKSKTCVQRS
ncbi:transposase [Klebsiella pneumoniae]|nr:transposase [Klebsiella pneumoniae]MCB3612271.1 transposase [Klebsiella pneumoniae]RIV96518.1 hypothetical protein D3C95_22560 [Escherichia coli]